MLNSAEQEICPANKSQITNNSFLLIIAEHENFSANTCNFKNANHFHIYCSVSPMIQKGRGKDFEKDTFYFCMSIKRAFYT